MSQSESTNSEGKPRELLLKTDGIPETTQNRIIIPPNQSLTSFSRVSYHEEYWKDFISKNEFDEIIDNACKLASLAYSQKRENDDRKLPSRVMLSFWIAWIMIIAFWIMSYYAALDKSDLLRVFSLVILIWTSAIFPIMILRIVFAKLPEFPTISSLVISRVSSYFDNINQLFSKRGIWWSISPELYIEMSIEQDEIQDVIEEENSDEIEPNQSNCMSTQLPNTFDFIFHSFV